jgi:DNA-binding FadR family transcriptional regulator
VSVRKLSDQIVEDILHQLGSGQLGEGSTVPSEMTLCATYNVTRGVVREAIRSLDAKGFIKVSQGMGTTIAPLHQWNVLDPIWVALNSDSSYFSDLQTTREMFEPEIAALAAKNATPENLQELQDILEEYTGIQEPVEWKIYSIFEGLDPRKRQAFALVRLMTSVYNWK